MLLNCVWEGVSPHVSVVIRVEEHTAHSWLRRIRGAQHGRVLWHYFCEQCGSLTEACGESSEGVQAVSHKLVDTNAIRTGLVLCPLQGAEKSSRTGDGD